MGVHCGEIPRNCSREHACGHCCFGCPSGDKQDATGTFLADAAKSGATIFTGQYRLFECSKLCSRLEHSKSLSEPPGIAMYRTHQMVF